jgi:ubiquinone/menaquinone biosynthesis C-methylase UbiE
MANSSPAKGDQWDEMAKVYEKLTTGTAIKPIGKMLERSNDIWPFSKADGILDNGCGPGPIMGRILKEFKIPESSSLTCSDFSDGMIEAVNKKKAGEIEADSKSPWNRVETFVQNAMDLKDIKDSSKSHVTAGWVYFMTPDPQKCLTESRRVLKDGGVLACSSWHDSQWLQLMNLLPKVRPDKEMPTIPKAWKDAAPMKAELEKAGFRDVEAHEVHVEMTVDKMEAFVDFMLHKMPHMVMLTKDFTSDEEEQLRKLVLQEGRKLCPEDPGILTGVSLVAVGTK